MFFVACFVSNSDMAGGHFKDTGEDQVIVLSKVIHPHLLKPKALPALLLHHMSNAVSNAAPHGSAWVCFTSLPLLSLHGYRPFHPVTLAVCSPASYTPALLCVV